MDDSLGVPGLDPLAPVPPGVGGPGPAPIALDVPVPLDAPEPVLVVAKVQGAGGPLNTLLDVVVDLVEPVDLISWSPTSDDPLNEGVEVGLAPVVLLFLATFISRQVGHIGLVTKSDVALPPIALRRPGQFLLSCTVVPSFHQ